jgi:hypothetical protein
MKRETMARFLSTLCVLLMVAASSTACIPGKVPFDAVPSADGTTADQRTPPADLVPEADASADAVPDGGTETLSEVADQEVAGDCGECLSECGNGVCEEVGFAPVESCESCSADCGKCPTVCGNAACEEEDKYQTPESCETCPDDCGKCPGVCPNGECDWDEDVKSCPVDCGECGDFVCSVELGEFCENCPKDCGKCQQVCGNQLCEFGETGIKPQTPSESIEYCPIDCGYCGDGVCAPSETDICAKDCGSQCGDGVCGAGEAPGEPPPDGAVSCPVDCGVCGDGVCGYFELNHPELKEEFCWKEDCGTGSCGNGECNDDETFESCVVDCPVCGDGVCLYIDGAKEDCPQDCVAPCGDGTCGPGENPVDCPLDCGACGDGVCSYYEILVVNCEKDCGEGCGDGVCAELTENEATCPADCQECVVECEEGWECGSDKNDCGQQCGACAEGEQCVEHLCENL